MSGRIIAAGGVTRWAHTLNGCLIFGMSTTYSELAERIMSGQTLSRDEIHELIVTSDGQDFALIEAASAIRRHEFRNMIAVHTDDEELAAALGTRSIAIDGYETLDLSADIDSEVLADKLAELGAGNTTGITVKLPANAVPMTLMRVLAITRMAAPIKFFICPTAMKRRCVPSRRWLCILLVPSRLVTILSVGPLLTKPLKLSSMAVL